MAIPGDPRFGQWADPAFGASLSNSGGSSTMRPTSPVLPVPDDQSQSASDNTKSYADYQSGFTPSETTAGKNGFSLGTRAWGENEVDPMTGGLGWKESYKDQTANTIMGYAEGGMVPQDTGDAAPADDDPFSLISSALAYGRQKFQMPAKLFGQPAEPVTGYADGGEVDGDGDDDGDPVQEQGVIPSPGQDQGAQQGQQQSMNPQSAMAYLKGEGAVGPEIAAAIEQHIDPHSALDPTDRRMKAVTAAGTPQTAFGLLQHYRQKFNAYSAFADAALRGSGGRPPNAEKAADALNKAYDHVPDGQTVRFTPGNGGMHVSVKTIPSKPAGPGGDQPNPNPFPTKDGGFGKRTAQNDGDEDDTQNFAEGGEVEDDNSMTDPAVRAYQSGDQENAGVLPEYDPSQDPMGAGEAVPEQQEESRGGAGEAVRKVAQPVGRAVADAAGAAGQQAGAAGQQVADQVSRTPGAVKNYFVKLGNLVGIGQKAGFDASLDKGGFDAAAVEHLTPTDLGPNMEDKGVTSERPMDNTGKGPYQDGALPSKPEQQKMAQDNPKGYGSEMGGLMAEAGKQFEQGIKDINQAFGGWASTQRDRLLAVASYRKAYAETLAKVAGEQDKSTHADKRAEIAAGGRQKVADTNAGAKRDVAETQQTHGDNRAHEKFSTQKEIADANRSSRENEGAANRENRTKNTVISQSPGAMKDADKFKQTMTNVGAGQQAPQQQQQQNYPPAPPDPAQRQSGKVYKAPNGRLGMWTGQGWQVLQ